MNLVQAFKMAFKSIFTKKTRSLLTMLGIIIGVASVVIMVSVIMGQNKKSMEYFEKQGDNKLIVEAYQWTGADVSQALYDYCLGLTDLVEGVTPDIQLWSNMTVKYGFKTMTNDDWQTMPQITLGSDQYAMCNNYTLVSGRDLSYLDIQKCNNVCVLGGKIAKSLFDFVDPIGKYITIDGNPYLVIGVYETKNVDNWPEWDNIILLPYTLNRTLNHNQRITNYSVKAVSASAAVEAAARLDGFLTGLINENVGWKSVRNNNDNINSMNEQLAMQALVLGGIAGISLLVGGIGIMNIMLVTVTERTREIGIRKAIGAERKSIITQFLIEAAVICGIGGILGIIIGYLGTMIAGKMLLQMILTPNVTITIGAFAFSVVLGIIFGLYPAIKASGLQPVDALRAE
ncbi:MAG: FtsX-like permease family protein [Oscillospiraceae bacterium]|nr:FtsX-like permease family protein [Oscillospiraceae bacterium]